MTAGILSRPRRAECGMRPINPRRDMHAVGDLLQKAFADELDEDGLRIVREMHRYKQRGLLGWLLAPFLMPAISPLGYVWLDDGQLVANANLLRVAGHSRRWVLANVAVNPDYRRQGIARALVKACLDRASSLGAEEVILQVRSHSRGAQILYASLGFHAITTRTVWRLNPKRGMRYFGETGRARARRIDEWQEQLSLANRVCPEGLIWPFPLSANLFRPSGLARTFGFESRRHWVWLEEGCLLGSLTARMRSDRRAMELILMVAPEARGQIEKPLLMKAFKDLPSENVPSILDYPTGEADEAIASLDFQPSRTLTWMILNLPTANRCQV